MELLGLNAALEPVKVLRCLNIQWNRRYFEAGEYALQLLANDWDTSIRYVYTAERPETGMVEKVETERTVKGDFVNVSGFFLEGMLNWKIIYPRVTTTGNLSQILKTFVIVYMPDTGVTVPITPMIGGDTTVDEEGSLLGDASYAALKLQAMSQRIVLDYETSGLRYNTWKGVDRTQEQSVNPFAVFSQGTGTVDELTLTLDSSDARNYAIATYEGGYRTIDLRASAAEPKRILYVETGLALTELAEGETPEEGGLYTEAELFAAVDAEARKQLQERVNIVNVDADVVQDRLVYRTDYDLGDLCEVRDDRLKLSYQTRIIEVREVWKNNEHTVTLTFGDKIPVRYKGV